ncbi:MAG: hypothetical protein CML02_12155 [Pseudooceanicola sp.]|jgi:hypothetical protein|nr:hypothetical protein [Pseudooceanicola sp.]
MSDGFVFKKPIPAVIDTGEFLPQAFEDPLFGKDAPPVFEDPLFGFTPQGYIQIPDIAGESFSPDGFVPVGFEDPLFG